MKWVEQLGPKAESQALSVGLPIEAFSRLAVCRAGTSRSLAWPSDLMGLVRLAEKEHAIEFLRLFSNDYWYCFPEFGYVELIPSDASPRRVGQIRRAEFAKLKIPELQAVHTDRGFRILRPTVRIHDRGQLDLAVLDETVGENGSYSRLVLFSQPISEAQARLIYLPAYR